MDPEPVSVFHPKIKPARSQLLSILIVSIIILTTASGFLVYQNMQLKQQIISLQNSPIPPSSLISPTPNSKANWKTHSDLDGFMFKYPSQWPEPWTNCISPTPESLGKDGYLNPNCLSTLFFPKKDIQDLADEDPLLYPELLSQQNLTIDGHIAKKRLFAQDPDGLPHYYEVKIYDSTVPIFAWITTISPDTDQTNTQQLIQTLDQILSTFKFLDQNSPTTTCKPRPPCLDATPRCMIPETSDMCPPNMPLLYKCPASGWVDCMPGPDSKPECSTEAMSWYKTNCPNFQGGAL